MKKIPTLFVRDYNTRFKLVSREVNPACLWVVRGEGVATIKLDGTCCMILGGLLFKRYEHRDGRPLPVHFEPADEMDPVTRKQPGWVPVGDGPEDRWHREAFKASLPDGTYELIGPKVQGNPERAVDHRLVLHGAMHAAFAPRDYEGLAAHLAENDIEGIVWHHPDGRMAKIKGKDFGLRRPGAAKA